MKAATEGCGVILAGPEWGLASSTRTRSALLAAALDAVAFSKYTPFNLAPPSR